MVFASLRLAAPLTLDALSCLNTTGSWIVARRSPINAKKSYSINNCPYSGSLLKPGQRKQFLAPLNAEAASWGRSLIDEAAERLRQLQPQAWQTVSAVCALAMLLCSLHRSTFTMLVPLMASDLGFSMPQIGALQSAMLAGYLVGQVPAGKLADLWGGERVLLAGLLLWSVATAITGLAATPTVMPPISILIAARVAMGLFSAAAMPSVSAMASRWVPADTKAFTISLIYACFNIGGMLGLLLTPLLAARCQWPGAFFATGAIGIACAMLGWVVLPPADECHRHIGQLRWQQQQQQQLKQNPVSPGPGKVTMHGNTTISATPDSCSSNSDSMYQLLSSNSSSGAATVEVYDGSGTAGVPLAAPGLVRRQTMLQLGVLCWSHAVIGITFVLQGWVPLYLQSLGIASLAHAGALGSLTLLAAVAVGVGAGHVSDRLISEGASRLTVRRGMHALSTVGCALAILPLALAPSVTPLTATVCLVANNALYAFSFAGFHAYVQDVAQADAGAVVGLTNSCSILLGMVGTAATGWIVAATGSYQAVFVTTGLLYLSSCMVFSTLLQGQPLHLDILRGNNTHSAQMQH